MLRERFQRLFRGSENWYGQYIARPDGFKIEAYTKAGPIPDEAWDRHLAGEQPGIGVVPITEESTCYWGALDLDDDDTDHTAVAKAVAQHGLPFVVCRSKSGGAHLFLFFKEPIKPVHLAAKLKRWSEVLGIQNPEDEEGRRAPLEIFPKQLSLSDGQKGNWLNLPYFGGDATNRYAVDEEGKPLSLADFLDLAESRRLTELELEAKKARISPDHEAFFKDGPPCLQTLHEQGFPRGTRNQGLYNIGIFLKLKFPDDWEARLRSYNADSGRVDPPLANDELDMVVRSLNRHDYTYKCSDAPIVGFCQRAACKKRDYGIDRFRRDRNAANLPSLGQLVSFEQEGEPQQFQLEIGGASVSFTPDELLSLQLFRKKTFSKTKRVIPAMKQHEWETRLTDLLSDHLVVDIPPDASPHGQFVAHLMRFLELREKSDRDEDVLMGKPWESGGRVYFQSQALIEFLERRRFRELNTSIGIWSAIRREGGGFTSLKIAGKDVDVWWMPVPTNEQTAAFSERGHDGPEF